MAVGDAVMDGQSPTQQLVQALNYEKLVFDVRQLPAGVLPVMNVCLNYYHALTGYKSASGKSTEWVRRNPQGWDLVSRVIKRRMERKRGNRNQ